MYSLLNAAQRGFHDMFTRTYGVMYQNHADVFQEFFKDLKVGSVDDSTGEILFSDAVVYLLPTSHLMLISSLAF